MKAKASSIAQKLLNLYRQAHVINGGWAAVNRVLLDEATDEVLTELPELPTGKMLVQHIKNLREGKGDRLIDAAKIKTGDKILDCTLGLGSDAIVESFVAGGVTALEFNPALAEVVRFGMKNFADDTPHVLNAMRGVEVVTADYADFLKTAAADSFDVVYFDPMFRHALEKSSGINPIRAVANHAALEPDSVREACRVARRCVVMKENARSGEFARLGFKIAGGGKYSPIAFGVIEL